MFGLGMPEILLILAIALIVIGPKKLPELAKTLGKAMGEFKRSAQDFKRSIDIETTIQDPVPAPSKKVKDIIKDVNSEKETQKDNNDVQDTGEASDKQTDETKSDSNGKPAASQPGQTEPTND